LSLCVFRAPLAVYQLDGILNYFEKTPDAAAGLAEVLCVRQAHRPRHPSAQETATTAEQVYADGWHGGKRAKRLDP
jgi:hypothetical protein